MLTDDFIDPHRDATDILFRISSLPDAGYHARVFGSQRYYLTASPEYVSRYGSPTSPEALHQHRTLVYGGSQEPTAGCFASAKRHGCTIR